jgi:hypothetical protein
MSPPNIDAAMPLRFAVEHNVPGVTALTRGDDSMFR